MNKNDAITLMKTSFTLVQWNLNRRKILNTLYSEDKQYKYPIFIDHVKSGKKPRKAFLISYVPQWFYGTIDGGFLMRETFSQIN